MESITIIDFGGLLATYNLKTEEVTARGETHSATAILAHVDGQSGTSLGALSHDDLLNIAERVG